jgi:hypothetical protein
MRGTGTEASARDPLTVARELRARVSQLLPGWLIGRLNEPRHNRSSGISQFTKFVSRPPRNTAEAEAYEELFEEGYLPVASGWPDFFVVSGKDEIFFVEVKGPGDELRPNQIVVLELLARAGIDTYIRYPDGYEAVGDSTPWNERS